MRSQTCRQIRKEPLAQDLKFAYRTIPVLEYGLLRVKGFLHKTTSTERPNKLRSPSPTHFPLFTRVGQQTVHQLHSSDLTRLPINGQAEGRSRRAHQLIPRIPRVRSERGDELNREGRGITGLRSVTRYTHPPRGPILFQCLRELVMLCNSDKRGFWLRLAHGSNRK